MRIIVAGFIVRGPVGGLIWHHLQYVLGLSRMGHDVYFFEDSQDEPGCYDPETDRFGTDPTYGLRFIDSTFKAVGLSDRWAYFDSHQSRWEGPHGGNAPQICQDAELLLSLSGVNPMRPWFQGIPFRAFIDTDPVFTQIKHLTDSSALQCAREHNSFFSFGENIGTSGCSVPDDGLPWQPTRQPVVLDIWPVTEAPEEGPFSTVMLWQSYKEQVHDGQLYGMKSQSFELFMDLPQKKREKFHLAVGGKGVPVSLLKQKGWIVLNPLEVALDPSSYQRYIQQSKAEFSVAKHGYVVSRSGWFSERSAAYLASGRPVLVQDTGFTDWFKRNEGVVSFQTLEEAVAGVDRISSNYSHHCRAARSVAEEFFKAEKVLTSLLDRATQSDS